MYEQQKGSIQPLGQQPEHMAVAMDFANAMLERFSPHEAIEIIRLIRQRWSEKWAMDMAEAEKKIAYLKESVSGL